MATTEEVVRGHRAGQQTLVQRALAPVVRLLSLLSRSAPGPSWTGGVDEQVLAVVIAAQQESADNGASYVGQVLKAAGVQSRLAGRVASRALAGTASDGRPLNSLLGYPIAVAVRNIENGMPPDEAFERLIRRMAMIVATQVADAGRVGAGVAMAADRVVLGYERMVNPSACSRCIVLAGRMYSWSEGFLRHPGCQCVHRPVFSIEDWRNARPENSPSRIFGRMSREEQDRTFGRAGAQAIRDGADINQVVNARRGISAAAGPGGRPLLATTEGTTRRGLAGRRLGSQARPRGERVDRSQVARLMPEEIYRAADGDRDEAIRLLRRFGYLTGPVASKPSRKGRADGDQGTGRKRAAEQQDGGGQAQGGAGGSGQPPGGPPPPPALPGGDGDRPRLDDLIPRDDQDAEARRGEIEDAIAERIGGEYTARDGTVFTVHVDEVDSEADEIRAKASIRVDGRLVGSVIREFYREADGTLWVDHAWLELDPSVQGRGFAPVFNRRMERWYGASGVDRIEIVAGLDKGGYVWATQGFDFADVSEASDMLERLELRAEPLRQWLEEHEDDEDVSDAEYERVEDLVEAAEELMNRAESVDFHSPDYPTAQEISQLGRLPGQGKDDRWLGKDVMMGSQWRGIRYL
ncbi:hypothetical protein [Actinomadura rubrisoli]|uniref:Uncharacterized protein n=1 Tax=Actinomadura rubrisoli TaxID=2530368 RepID=A0A4R5BVS5_9ACTN|nr:hypothetical protein [Actinomadura rubrisoli]TDD88362.1 hypothetical protein E1298_15240 [Actinomadura rubrisoli]